jgi:hypothetical protein
MRNNTMNFTRWTATGLLALLAAAPASAQDEGLQYAIVGTDGVTVRNVRDAAGIPIGQFGAGTVLAVHKTMGRWSQVEPAGGLTCWVLGAYLNETGVSGRYDVNANAVNMRPLASSGKESFPLMEKLYLGDTVRIVSRLDPSVEFAEDWIQIRSPQGVHGWALTGSIQAAPDSTVAETTWTNDWKEVMDAMGGEVTPSPAATKDATDSGSGGDLGQAAVGSDDLVSARRMMNSSPPMYAEAKVLFTAVLSKAESGSPLAIAAQNGMSQADAYMRIEAIQRQLESERAKREREDIEREAELQRRRDEKTPLMGRYDARGWVESRKLSDGGTGWFLRFAGKDSCAIQCTSGRYDISMFAGYEVGVVGRMMNEPGAGQTSCDMRSIEVLSGRSKD